MLNVADEQRDAGEHEQERLEEAEEVAPRCRAFCSAVSSAPVIASSPAGRTGVDAVGELVLRDAVGRRPTMTDVTSPGRAEQELLGRRRG